MEKVEKDYEELLRLFNKHKVRYCIVGAFAVALYAKPRYTKDIDIMVESSIANGRMIINALNEFGFGTLKLSANDFSKEGMIIQLGYEPIRSDIVTSIEGCSFERIWKNKRRGQFGNEKVYFIGLDELIKNKRGDCFVGRIDLLAKTLRCLSLRAFYSLSLRAKRSNLTPFSRGFNPCHRTHFTVHGSLFTVHCQEAAQR